MIIFKTPTVISPIDIISMGDSSKRNDASKIGQFDSGLKYAIALLLRNNIEIKIITKSLDLDPDLKYDRGYITTYYTFGTYIKYCSITNKSKTLIKVDLKQFLNDEFYDEKTIETGFALALGYNWELWMALRELWSNAIDEGGDIILEENYDFSNITNYNSTIITLNEDYDFSNLPDSNTTIIALNYDRTPEFSEIIHNKHLYINTDAPLFKISDTTEILNNDEKYLRIYKNNILIYSDINTHSDYAFNIQYGEIDERRILNNISVVKDKIYTAIASTHNEEFLKSIIASDFNTDTEDFLNADDEYYYVNNTIFNIATQVYSSDGDVKSYRWIINSIKKKPNCIIPGKVIKSISDHLWSYTSSVSVDTTPTCIEPVVVENKPVSFTDQIKTLYNFNLDVEVKTAKLTGNVVIADKYLKCLIIDESFSLEADFDKFIIEYLDLKYPKVNIMISLSNYIIDLIKK